MPLHLKNKNGNPSELAAMAALQSRARRNQMQERGSVYLHACVLWLVSRAETRGCHAHTHILFFMPVSSSMQVSFFKYNIDIKCQAYIVVIFF